MVYRKLVSGHITFVYAVAAETVYIYLNIWVFASIKYIFTHMCHLDLLNVRITEKESVRVLKEKGWRQVQYLEILPEILPCSQQRFGTMREELESKRKTVKDRERRREGYHEEENMIYSPQDSFA